MGDVKDDLRCRSQREGGTCQCAMPGLTPHQRQMAARYGICRRVLGDWIAGGVCQCCGVPLARGWCIDHDHSTGRARGVVCRRCNIAAGFMEDPEYVRIVRAYLTRTDAIAIELDMTPPSGTRRKRGLGAVYQRASDGLWVGAVSYMVDGRRKKKVVYAQTREQLSGKLAQARREVALLTVPAPR